MQASRSVKRQGTELPLAAPHESEMPETPTVPATHLSQPAEMFLQEHKSNTHAAFKAGAAKSIISITASARVGDNQVRPLTGSVANNPADFDLAIGMQF